MDKPRITNQDRIDASKRVIKEERDTKASLNNDVAWANSYNLARFLLKNQLKQR